MILRHTMNPLAINTLADEVSASADFCRSECLGLEVTAFAFPENLEGDTAPLIESHRNVISDIAPVIPHGPFLDLVATSRDPAIVAVTKQRHEVALHASQQIGASYYVAHTNYNPLIRDPDYRRNWKELIASAKHPHLKATLDNGHALVFSDVPASSWIETLGDALAHCHLHDNSGEIDEHKPVGEGKERWPELLAAASTYAPRAILVAESDRLASSKLSVERLRLM
jgi:sugar phosphate isomerase/epimerase